MSEAQMRNRPHDQELPVEATAVTLGSVSEMTRALGPLLPVPDLIWGNWRDIKDV